MSVQHVPTVAEEADRLIQQTYVIDDLCTERGQSRRAVADAIKLLEVLPHAVSHGRIGLVDEYIDRVLTMLRPHAAKE